jgi:hypothetical protein
VIYCLDTGIESSSFKLILGIQFLLSEMVKQNSFIVWMLLKEVSFHREALNVFWNLDISKFLNVENPIA